MYNLECEIKEMCVPKNSPQQHLALHKENSCFRTRCNDGVACRFFVRAHFIILVLCTFLFPHALAAQSTTENVRFHLWAARDAYPGLAEAQDLTAGEFDYPIKSMKQIAPVLVGGMVYGWNFTYTPSDKARNVEEYFELEEIQPFESLVPDIKYEQPWLDEVNLNCWVHYTRTPHQVQNYKLWSSIKNPKIAGRGYGKIEKGFDGITDAIADAAKNAVREHFRAEIKNKPKEITGSILIRSDPTLGIKSGQYVINLDFFLESVKIVSYVTF